MDDGFILHFSAIVATQGIAGEMVSALIKQNATVAGRLQTERCPATMCTFTSWIPNVSEYVSKLRLAETLC